jgi:hypothetical protein
MESPDMPGASEQSEEPTQELVEDEQEHVLPPETPLVEQATECSTPKAEGFLEMHTIGTFSTPVTSSDLPSTATPRSSISPEPEVAQHGAGLDRSKRPHAMMAGPSPFENRKVAKLSESLSDEQDATHSLLAASHNGQTSKTDTKAHMASVEPEEEDEEEMPTKKRNRRKAGVLGDDRSQIDWVEPDDEEEGEISMEERVAKDAEVTRSAFDTTALSGSSFDSVGSAESDGEDEEEMPTKRRVARRTPETNEKAHNTPSDSDEEDQQNLQREEGVARKVDASYALSPTFLSRSLSSVHKTIKRSRIASVGSDEEDEEEPPTKKRSTRKTEVTEDESPANLVEDSVVLEPTTLFESSSDSETSGGTIFFKETVDPRKRPSQPSCEPDPVTTAKPSQPPQESYLHLLPGELRNRIYTQLGFRSSRLNLDTFLKPNLMVAYPDLENEMLSVMLSDNKLRVPVYSDFRIKVSEAAPHPKKPSSVKDFQVGTVAIDPKSWVMAIDPRFVTIKHIGMRILEVPEPDRENDIRPICDYFLNVRVVKGKLTVVSHKTTLWASTATQRESRSMCDLATARAKRFAEQDGFAGFTWKQVQEIAASFESVIAAKDHFTKTKGKVILN